MRNRRNDPPYNEFEGATSGVPGKEGIVPAPEAGEQTLVLRGSGEWAAPLDESFAEGLLVSTDFVVPVDANRPLFVVPVAITAAWTLVFDGDLMEGAVAILQVTQTGDDSLVLTLPDTTLTPITWGVDGTTNVILGTYIDGAWTWVWLNP